MVNDITLRAEAENTKKAIAFVRDELDRMKVPTSTHVAMVTAVEEVFLNISSYAYGGNMGDVTIHMETDEHSCSVTLTFIDKGAEFDPLKKEDPDLDVPIEEREIGGLGIMMVKNMMDDVSYSREDGENRLTIAKTWDK